MHIKQRIRQSEFRKGGSQLTHLIFFSDQCMRQRLWMLSASTLVKLWDSISHSILLEELAVCGLDGCTVYCMKNWMDGCALRVVLNGVISSW